jgi:hypothetical protein
MARPIVSVAIRFLAVQQSAGTSASAERDDTMTDAPLARVPAIVAQSGSDPQNGPSRLA